MAWLQLTLECDRDATEKLSGLLEQFGVISVSLSAASNEALFVEGGNIPEDFWVRTRISALLHEDTDLDILLVCLRNCAGAERIHTHHIELIGDKDWVYEVQLAHRPQIFGNRLCICPGWCVPPDHIPHLVMLDPGLAFGTGAHDTTTMCLEWLVQNAVAGKAVIDYGCGSGILALAASALGARHVYAVDIDPQALQAARSNTERNHRQCNITVGRLEEIELPVADILIANMLLGPILKFAPAFAGQVCGGGVIILSGLLAGEIEECLAAYQTWFNMEPPCYRREWAMVQGMRRHSPRNNLTSAAG